MYIPLLISIAPAVLRCRRKQRGMLKIGVFILYFFLERSITLLNDNKTHIVLYKKSE